MYREKMAMILQLLAEIMAVLCLSNDIKDLKERLGKLIVGYTYVKSVRVRNR